VVKAEKVTEEFHARFSATARHYRYVILNRRARPALKANRVWHVPETLDLGAMQKAAALLVGTHDFSSFRASECQATSPIRTLDRLELIQVNDEIHIEASARSFLHHQMRNMAGSLRYVGNQKWSLADMQAAIDAKNRAAGGMTAPPQGLTLMRVDY
jgi:tRNA pseudouridine38-40 synthase